MSRPLLTVCILGMHRSGSSVAAQILLGNGFRTGSPWSGRTRFNPEGHWEDRHVVRTNKKLLLRFGGTWDRPPTLPGTWLKDPEVAALLRRSGRYRDRQVANRKPYYFKDPRTSLVVPFWRAVFGPDLKFVVVVRSPAAVARSLVRRQREWLGPRWACWRLARSLYHRIQGAYEPLQPLDSDRAHQLWHRYYDSILHALDGLEPSVLVYERLLADPPGQIRRVLAELGAAGAGSRTDMVKPGLSHAPGTGPDTEVAALERKFFLGLGRHDR